MKNTQFITQIDVTELFPSKSNARRAMRAAFLDDLTASVREQGVLNPLIVRVARVGGSNEYEVVAGHQRLEAAKRAGLKAVPCIVRELGDEEAKDVQIVENVQRDDMHPLDEAIALRSLVQTMKDVKAVAARVGKPEAYVKRRMKLVMLGEDAATEYIQGRISDAHAEILAGLSEPNQKKALKHVKDTGGAQYISAEQLEAWVRQEFTSRLDVQPWLGKPEAMKAVGTCKECPPNKDTLFGAAKEGECTAVACWERKAGKYLAHLVGKNPGAVLVSEEYGGGRKGVLKPYEYREAKKGECDKSVTGVFADGEKLGKTRLVCVDGKCATHWPGRNGYVPPTPEEKAEREAERQRELEKQQREEAKYRAKYDKGLEKVTAIGEKEMLIVLAALVENGMNGDLFERNGIEPDEDEGEVQAVGRHFAKLDAAGRARLLVDAALEQFHDRDAVLEMLGTLGE